MLKMIKKQYYYAYLDYKSNKRSTWFELLEIIIAALLISYSIQNASLSLIGIKKLAMLPTDKMLRVVENCSYENFDSFINDTTNYESVIKVYDLIDLRANNRITVNNSTDAVLDGALEPTGVLKVNSAFFPFFSVNSNSVDIEIFDEIADSSDIPVLLGHSFKKKYKKGDLIFTDSSDVRFRVVGFLKKGEYYVDIFQRKDPEILDQCIVTPEKWSNDSMIDAYATIINTYLVCQDPDNAHAISNDISQAISFLGLENMSFQMRYVKNDIMNATITMLGLCALVLLFIAIGTICRLEVFIHNHSKEFAIHIMYGATIKDIIIRIVMKYSSILVVAFFITLLTFGELSLSLYALLIELLLSAIMLKQPIDTLTRKSASAIIKGV